MTRPARRALAAWMVTAMAAGALLLAPAQAGATTESSSHESTVAAGSQRIDPGELQRLLDQIVAVGAPGAATRVRDGHGVAQAASGVADLRTGRPMRPGLTYRVGSVTKPFVATVVLQLVAEGRLSVSDTVQRWLPGILPYGDRVTIRQLLNHTSGVPDYTLEPLVRLYTFPHGRFRAWRPRELVALIADQPPDFPPGTAWSYSNTGYILAGLIVQAATGRKLGQELARRIFRPLGLRDTYFPVNRPTIPGRNARGYSIDPFAQQPGPLLDFTVYNPSLAWAAGALVSNLADLERFSAAAGWPAAPAPAAGGDDDSGPHRPARLRLRPGAGGDRDARWASDRPRRRHLGLPQHRLEYRGRPPAAWHHDERGVRHTRRVRGVQPGVDGNRHAAPGRRSPGRASTRSSLRAAVQARESARTAPALARAGMAVHAQP